MKVSRKNILTAFPVAGGQSFLGFFFSSSTLKFVQALTANATRSTPPTYRGVIWGKKQDYLHTAAGESIIRHVAALSPLISTLPLQVSQVRRQENVTYVGHLDKPAFRALLANSKFLLGLGDPLSGPSGTQFTCFTGSKVQILTLYTQQSRPCSLALPSSTLPSHPIRKPSSMAIKITQQNCAPTTRHSIPTCTTT